MAMQQPIRVVIVDDHQVFVDALSMVLADEPDFAVVATANCAEVALEVLANTRCDVVTLDLLLGDDDGLALGREIIRRWPQTAIVVISGANRDDQVRAAVQCGIRGWVSKVEHIDTLLVALRGVSRGETHIAAALLTNVLMSLTGERTAGAGEPANLRDLTERESEVLACLVEGMSREAIAEALHVSRNTVRTHVQSILHKLKVHSALAAVAIAQRSGTPWTPERHNNAAQG